MTDWLRPKPQKNWFNGSTNDCALFSPSFLCSISVSIGGQLKCPTPHPRYQESELFWILVLSAAHKFSSDRGKTFIFPACFSIKLSSTRAANMRQPLDKGMFLIFLVLLVAVNFISRGVSGFFFGVVAVSCLWFLFVFYGKGKLRSFLPFKKGGPKLKLMIRRCKVKVGFRKVVMKLV